MEFTPELNEQILEAIKRRIEIERQNQVASARGEAVTRGIPGSSYEATRVGLANKVAMDAQTDAMVQLATENARRLREERLLNEQRQYETGQAGIQREFESEEAKKQRSFQESLAQRQLDYQSKQNRQEMLAGGGAGILSLAGDIYAGHQQNKLLEKLFGVGGTGVAGGNTILTPGTARTFGQGFVGSRGVVPTGTQVVRPGLFASSKAGLTGFATAHPIMAGTAGALGGAYAGKQLFGNKNYVGSGIGSALGTVVGGPVGGVVGGVLGGAAQKYTKGISMKRIFGRKRKVF